MIYWDHNATSPLRRSVRERFMDALERYHANPNSMHRPGQDARAAIEKSRRALADAIGCDPIEIVYTASATEANLIALFGLWIARTKENPKRKKILISPLEHSSVHENTLHLGENFGAEIIFTPLTNDGLIDLRALEGLLRSDEIAFCSTIAANNESGVIQPWKEIAALCDSARVPFHTDLVQCFARTSLRLSETKLSCATLCFHKSGGPKGVGILYVKKGVELHPLIRGGGQEKKRRSGTENLAAIVASEALLEELPHLQKSFSEKISSLRDAFEADLTKRMPSAKIVGKNLSRIPNTSYVIFPNTKSDAILLNLDLKGVCASSGSACASGMLTPSRTLLNLGYSEADAVSAIRFSLGPDHEAEEATHVADILESALARMAH